MNEPQAMNDIVDNLFYVRTQDILVQEEFFIFLFIFISMGYSNPYFFTGRIGF